MTCKLLDQLNDQQRAVVTAPDGPALVLGGAGTGKTFILPHRVAWLVQEHDIRPWQILFLTFTTRATKEILERLNQLLSGGIESVWGGTFHFVANRMLRHHAERIGYERSFDVLEEDDASRLLNQCIADLGLSGTGNKRQFPKPKILLDLFGLATNREADLRETLEEHFPAPDTDIAGMLKVADLYAHRKRDLQSMDRDDLIVNALRLLRECPDVAEQYGRTFRHILVDDYQNASRIQSDFVDLLAFAHYNLMVAGDDFQSIDSWRGADIDNFFDFPSRHPGTRIYKLENNYRNSPDIIDVANDVIAGNLEQHPKNNLPVRIGGGMPPVLVQLADGHQQARYVVETIMGLVESGEARPCEIAVLYRSHFHAMDLQLELARAQMPYIVESGVRFFEQAHIKDILALLRLATNPSDALSFFRWMTMFPKVGPKRAQAIWDAIGGRIDLRSPVARRALVQALPAKARSAWQDIETALFPSGDTSILERPGELVKACTEIFYGDYINATFDNPQSRRADITDLCDFAAKYPTAEAFLDELTLLSASAADDHNDSCNSLYLGSIHQAKGREWKAVFVLWMVQGMFPSPSAMVNPSAMAEERRLFYVAVTRAKERLWLCCPRMRHTIGGDLQYCTQSAFIEEIAPSKLKIDHPATTAPSWRFRDWDASEPTLTNNYPEHTDFPNTTPCLANNTASTATATCNVADSGSLLDDALAELDSLIGLDDIKAEVANFAKYIHVTQRRKAAGLKVPPITYHMVFTGNPGTGKTTVARIMAKIYRALGVLKKGHLVETDRGGLVSQYVGHTALKTGQVIDSALDGVLFIDEAYSIATGGEKDFGPECIATLLKRMEEDRDRLVVIVAGYPDEMRKFIDSTPGLESRFNRYFHFPDYSVKELADILRMIARENEYILSPDVERYIAPAIVLWTQNRDRKFGNARYARNLFEKAVERQAIRISSIKNPTREDLMTITMQDVGIELEGL